jgi:hypothetical protein
MYNIHPPEPDFLSLMIQSKSEKYNERESLTDLLRENEPVGNSRQSSAVFTKSLAIHHSAIIS